MNPKTSNFREDLTNVLNKYSMESESNTPDFILAKYLENCLDSFNCVSGSRTKLYRPVMHDTLNEIPIPADRKLNSLF